jgi:hypothetical protein
MRLKKRATGEGILLGDPVGTSAPSLTLHVPARPESLGIVRLVVMSCGASAGLALEEIFSLSRDVAEAFADILVTQPDARIVMIRTQTGASDVDLVPVGSSEV